MTTARTSEQAIDAARAVAAALAKDALERDRANNEPEAEAQLLRDAGLPSLLLPTRVSGGGLDWAAGGPGDRRGGRLVNSSDLVWGADEAGIRRWGTPSAARQWLWGDAVNPVDRELELVRDSAERPQELRNRGVHRRRVGRGRDGADRERRSRGAAYGKLVSSVKAVGGLADVVGRELAEADAAGTELTWHQRGELVACRG